MSRSDNLNRISGTNGMKSVTVSYKRTDDAVGINKVGYGLKYWDAIWDADSQLPEGEWVRVCISNPGSIYGDVKGIRRLTRQTLRQGEGETVTVEKKVTVSHG